MAPSDDARDDERRASSSSSSSSSSRPNDAVEPGRTLTCVVQADDRVGTEAFEQSHYGRLTASNRALCERDPTCAYELDESNGMREYPPFWRKVFAVKRILESGRGCARAVWVDTDAALHGERVTCDENTAGACEVKTMPVSEVVGELFGPRADFFFSRDPPPWYSSMCAGVWGVKNTPKGREILREWVKSYPSELWSLDGALGHWKCHDPDTGDACQYAGAMYEQGAFTAHVLPTYREQGVLREVPSCAINAPCESRLEASLRGAAACHFPGYYDPAKFVASSRADVVLGTRSPSSRVVANANATLGGTSLVACVHGVERQLGFIDSVEVHAIVFASVALACVAVGFNTLRGKRSGRRGERGYNAVDERVPAI